MTGFSKRFPTSFRFGIVTIALLAIAGLAPLHASAAPSAQEVENAKDRATELGRQVRAATAAMERIMARADAIAVVLDRETARYELITSRLLVVQQRLDRSRDRYEAIVEQLNERAREAFMEGPGSGLEFVLGATSLSDLSDRLEFVGAIAQRDADLATEVQNLKNRLAATERDLEALRQEQRAIVARLRDRQAELAQRLDAAAAIAADLETKRAEAARLSRRLSKAASRVARVTVRRRWNACERRHSGRLERDAQGLSRRSTPRLRQRIRRTSVCRWISPARGRRHRGAIGTPIRATFDGTAQTSQNTLGGLAVYVYGARGYTYNAHLSAYSSQSNGPVSAGDIIGYVGARVTPARSTTIISSSIRARCRRAGRRATTATRSWGAP